MHIRYEIRMTDPNDQLRDHLDPPCPLKALKRRTFVELLSMILMTHNTALIFKGLIYLRLIILLLLLSSIPMTLS